MEDYSSHFVPPEKRLPVVDAPVKQFFTAANKLRCSGVYYHYREWGRDGSFKTV
jgi:hypothetical protein